MLRYLRTVRKEINILVFFSLVILLLKVLWLNSIPEWFHFGAELGEIVDRLCASILSSYVFFIIVVHIKSEKDKENVYPYALGLVRRIVGNCSRQLGEFQKASGVELQLGKIRKEDIESAFKNINPNSQAPLFLGFPGAGRHANWLEYMDFHCTSTIRLIEKLLRKITFIDSKLVRCLADLDNCSHFIQFQNMPGSTPVRNENLDAWAYSFFEYCVLVSDLNEYAESNLSTYPVLKVN